MTLGTTLREHGHDFAILSVAGVMVLVMPDIDRVILAFESRHWFHVGAKEQTIRERMGVLPVPNCAALRVPEVS